MARPRMHDEQIDVEPELLRALVRAQHPQWGDLPIRLLDTSGTDNAIFRLGDELVVRVPIIGWAADQVDLELAWLPRLAPHLPLAVHEPVAVGEPGEGYPWRWLVYRWIEAENAHHDTLDDPVRLALDLAGFARALWSLELPDAPRSARGWPLRDQDATITDAIERMRPELGDRDADILREAWAAAIGAPTWRGGFHPVHGDLSGNNLLLRDGRLHAVIDWSCFGIGEPAIDVEVAWELFDDEARHVFFTELDVDDDTWLRCVGWAIRSVYGIPYYRETNPGIVERAWRRLHNVIAAYAAR
jgi:aminoglycoside phosphotransferase (APT) family kinase protein